MRVALLVDEGDPHGLTAVAERMRGDDAAGVDATLIAAGDAGGAGATGDAAPSRAPAADVPRAFDLAVATGWRSVARLDEVAAQGSALMVMDMEDRALPAASAEAEAAAAIFTLALPAIVPAAWIAAQLQQLRPAGAPAPHVVHPGVDRDVFAPPATVARGDDGAPLRVLVLGAPGDAATGLDEALAAAAAMREPATVSQLDPGTTGPAERATAYAAADVVLTLPRIAGLPRGPLEAFHRGATCVMTAVTGHDEYVVDSANGLLTSWDDERGTSRLLDLLARDRDLLHRLRGAALQTAHAWPDADAAARALAATLRRIAEEARA